MATGTKPSPKRKGSLHHNDIVEKRPLRLSGDSVFKKYIYSGEYRRALRSGKYIFVDGLLILRPLAIFLLENKINVHDFFKSKKLFGSAYVLPEYCLSEEFIFERVTPKPDELYHSAGRLKRHRIAHATRIATIEKISEDDFMKIIGGGGDEPPPPPNDFGALLTFYMNQKGVTEEGLAELTGLSDRSIRRFKNNSDGRPALESVVAICIALHLLPHQSANLISAAGYHLRQTNKTEQAYQYLIDVAYNESVYDCNAFLKRMTFAPLTNL